MKKLTLTWILPLIIAVALVVAARIWLFSTYVVKNYAMSPNLVAGDVALCIKSIAKKRNKVVLYAPLSNDSLVLQRQIAIPGDTLTIKEGVVLVNGKKIGQEFDSESYFFLVSDSVKRVCKYLNDNGLVADFKNAHLGCFECKLSDKDADQLKATFTNSRIKRKSVEPKVRPIKELFGRAFYWNYDNLGSILVPKKGMKIRLGKRSFYLYKQLIERETNNSLEIRGLDVYLENKRLDIYTFKKDYVFLVNDNRGNYNDSRTNGFVSRDRLKGTYMFRLPW